MTTPKTTFLLINMDRSLDRLENCQSLLNQYGVVYRRISAVDGREISPQELDVILAPEFSGYYKVLTAGELGCYLSHRKCWQYLLDNNLDYAVVLEDDFTLSGDISAIGSYIEAIVRPWDCIKLMEYPQRSKSLMSVPCLDKHLIRYDKIPSGTLAYVISKDGAQKMLRHSQKISRPVDIDFQYWWESDILVYGLRPYFASINHQQERLIDQDEHRKSIRKSMLKKHFHTLYFKYSNKKYLKRLADKSK